MDLPTARIVDLSARAAADREALRASEAQLRLALDLAELGTWLINVSDGSATLDERAAQIVGLPAGRLDDVVRAQADAIHPADFLATQNAFAAGIASGKPFSLAYRVVHPDGSVHHVVSRGIVMVDEAGLPIRIVGTNRDATAEYAMVAERERLLVAEREAREQAEAANRAKAQFLAVMSRAHRRALTRRPCRGRGVDRAAGPGTRAVTERG